MIVELDILKQVCQKLNKNHIPYMLTGSFAANFYAIPRMTRDIDIVIELQPSDVNKMLQMFQGEFYIDKGSIDEALEYQSMFNILHNETVFKIDFIIRKNQKYRETEFKRKRNLTIQDTNISIVAPEDLIISKMYWAKDSFSTTQINDIKNLMKNIQDLDYNYIEMWVKELELMEIYNLVHSNE